MSQHVVAAAAVQLVVGSRLYFLEKGAVVPEGVDEADIDRLVEDGLIEEYVEPIFEPVETPAVFSQDDVDAAVKAATEAKDAELEQARKLVEEKATEVAQGIADLAAERAEFDKQVAAQADAGKKTAPASKASAAKQS